MITSAKIKPEVIDRIFDKGFYERWLTDLDSYIEEQSRGNENQKRYVAPWAAALKKQLDADLGFAEKNLDDYIAFLERSSATGKANFEEGEKIQAVFVLA